MIYLIYCTSTIPFNQGHQYGISVAESQTFFLAKRPSAAMSEEKRLSLAGYSLLGSRFQYGFRQDEME